MKHVSGSLIGLSLFSFLLLPVFGEDCTEHWVSGISDCGQIVQLDNRTSWRVHSMDTTVVVRWHLGDSVRLCRKAGTMKNMDVEAKNQVNIHVKPASWFSQLSDPDACPFDGASRQ